MALCLASWDFSKDELVSFNVKNSFLIEEVRDSSVYPGMLTVYRKNVVDARIIVQ